MNSNDKPLVWLHGELKTPPFSKNARLEAGFLLRQLQSGEKISLPFSRPMPTIGLRCHELRINDENKIWRIIYRIDSDAIIILEIFQKQTRQTSKQIIDTCKRRLRLYDEL
jgi:phage-related protein